ncbi:unnamed protein product, partial [Meganyctiphanes norvegica]
MKTIIYASKELISYTFNQLANLPCDDSAWCLVKLTNDTKILVGCIYRSPSSSEGNNELLINKIIKASELAGQNKIRLMGNFNVKDINLPENDPGSGVKSLPYKFHECFNYCFLYQHLCTPTRFR